MEVLQAINAFYYKMALHELQIMNEEDYYQGLSYNSILYINIISQQQNCTVSKLSELLRVTKPAVTSKVNELVKQGALVRVQSEKDKRVFYIQLSPLMQNTIGIYDIVFEKMEQKLLQSYTREELKTFCGILHTIAGYEWSTIQNE